MQSERYSHENLQLQAECQRYLGKSNEIDSIQKESTSVEEEIKRLEDETQALGVRTVNQEKLVLEVEKYFLRDKKPNLRNDLILRKVVPILRLFILSTKHYLLVTTKFVWKNIQKLKSNHQSLPQNIMKYLQIQHESEKHPRIVTLLDLTTILCLFLETLQPLLKLAKNKICLMDNYKIRKMVSV